MATSHGLLLLLLLLASLCTVNAEANQCYNGLGVIEPANPPDGEMYLYPPNLGVASCEEVPYNKNGYYGSVAGYCEAYYFKAPCTNGSSTECTYYWTQCQPDNEKTPEKPGYQMDCEKRKTFTIPDGAAAGTRTADSKTCCVSEVNMNSEMEICNTAGAVWAGVAIAAAASALVTMLMVEFQ